MQEYGMEVVESLQLDKTSSMKDIQSHCWDTSFQSLPVDVATTGLYSECKQLWHDVVYVRSSLPEMCGARVLFDLPNLGLLMGIIHPLYVQASAVAHSAPVEPSIWREESHDLHLARKELQQVQKLWSELSNILLPSFANARFFFARTEESSPAFFDAFKQITESLERMSRRLKEQTSKAGKERQRFNAFSQNIEFLRADISHLTYVLLRMLRLDNMPEFASSDIPKRLAVLANLDEAKVDSKMLSIADHGFAEDLADQMKDSRGWQKGFQDDEVDDDD